MANRNRRRRGGMPATNVQIVRTREGRLTTEKIDQEQPTFPHRRPGQPAKLTPEVERRLLDCLRAGNHLSVCSNYVGLSPRTTEDWMRRGRGHDNRRPATAEYIRFVKLVEEAKAATEVLVVGNMIADTKTDQRAREFWLRADPERARRWPKDGADAGDFVTVPGSAPAQLAPGNVTYDQRRQVAYVMISPDEVDGMVGKMLADGRTTRAARLAADTIEEDERPHDGTRIARLDGLRSDEGGAADEDD